jgi:hypothetical protein
MDLTAENIHAKVSDGRLPRKPASRSWGGYGSGKLCSGCDEPILKTQVEHELDFDGSRTVRFHAACEAIWRSLVVKPAGKATDLRS